MHRFGIFQFACYGIVELENNMRSREGDKPFSSQFLRIVKDVIDLDNAEMRHFAGRSRDISHSCG